LRGAVADRFARPGAVNRAHLARLSGRIWCHGPNLRVGAGGMSRATSLAAATPPR